MAKQQTFSMKDLPCEKVVVFKDRAEVKRLVVTRLNKGENELVISGVTNSIDRDSVRVEGHGKATVLDVVCQSKRVDSDKATDNTTERIKELKNELDRLESQQNINRCQTLFKDTILGLFNHLFEQCSGPNWKKSTDK